VPFVIAIFIVALIVAVLYYYYGSDDVATSSDTSVVTGIGKSLYGSGVTGFTLESGVSAGGSEGGAFLWGERQYLSAQGLTWGTNLTDVTWNIRGSRTINYAPSGTYTIDLSKTVSAQTYNGTDELLFHPLNSGAETYVIAITLTDWYALGGGGGINTDTHEYDDGPDMAMTTAMARLYASKT